MPKIQMEVIPEPTPGTAAIIKLARPNFALVDPYVQMRGNGDTDYVCGCCRVLILEKVERGRIINIVFKCAHCNAFNIIRGT